MDETSWARLAAAREKQTVQYRKETFWFNMIVWGSLATIPIGLILMVLGALTVGISFIFVGLISALFFVVMALFGAGQ